MTLIIYIYQKAVAQVAALNQLMLISPAVNIDEKRNLLRARIVFAFFETGDVCVSNNPVIRLAESAAQADVARRLLGESPIDVPWLYGRGYQQSAPSSPELN